MKLQDSSDKKKTFTPTSYHAYSLLHCRINNSADFISPSRDQVYNIEQYAPQYCVYLKHASFYILYNKVCFYLNITENSQTVFYQQIIVTWIPKSIYEMKKGPYCMALQQLSSMDLIFLIIISTRLKPVTSVNNNIVT